MRREIILIAVSWIAVVYLLFLLILAAKILLEQEEQVAKCEERGGVWIHVKGKEGCHDPHSIKPLR